MKKALYTFAVAATALCFAACSSEASTESTENNTQQTKKGIAEGTQIVHQPEESMIKEVVEGVEGKPITIETARGKMHGRIDYPGAITITDTTSSQISAKLIPAQGKDTYQCAVLFTGTQYKGKIWNFTRKPVMVNVEWQYEDGSILTDQVALESKEFGFTHAEREKGVTKTITYTVVDLE